MKDVTYFVNNRKSVFSVCLTVASFCSATGLTGINNMSEV